MKPKVFTSAQLAQYAAVAVEEGYAADVFDYWFELGEMIAAFAIQISLTP